MSTQKILLIILFSLVTIGIGAALYFTFFAPIITPEPTINAPVVNAPINAGLPGAIPTIPGVEVPTEEISPEVPSAALQIPALEITPQQLIIQEIAQGGLTRTDLIVNRSATSAIRAGNSIAFYNSGNRLVQIVDPNGDIKNLSDDLFANVQNMTWSPNADKAVLEFPDGNNILYDFDDDKAITLPPHWEDFSFNRSGDKVVYKSIGLDDDNTWLAIVNDDGSGVKPIEPLGNNADKVDVNVSPNELIVAFSHTGEARGFSQEEIYLIGQNGENFRSLLVNGQGFIPLWSPTGEKLVYSVYSERENFLPELWVVNSLGNDIGTQKRYLNLLTYADKCTFANADRLICAVPTQLPEKAGIFRELSEGVPDLIYEVNLAQNTRRLLAIPEQDMTVEQVIVSEDENTLFLLDSNGAVFEIAI